MPIWLLVFLIPNLLLAVMLWRAYARISGSRTTNEHNAPTQAGPNQTQLQETHEYMQCVINSMPSILIGVNPKAQVTHWNLAAQMATGLTPEESIGAPISQVFPQLAVSKRLISNTIIKGKPYTRNNIQTGQGHDATFTDITIYPLVASAFSGAVVMASDVSKQVRIENLMIQNEKMRSLGELAAGIAHELNNPLMGILNNAQNTLRRSSPELSANEDAAKALGTSMQTINNYLEKREVLQFIKNITEAGEHAASIVSNMLAFSRSNQDRQKHIRVQELIAHALELATNTFQLKTHSGIEMPKITQIYQDNLPSIYCSATEIQQVILNLLRNAAQAFQSEEYGPPLDPEVTIHARKERQFLIIEVSDNGPGMPQSVREHIFEPFFTTKDVGQGTGLGLSVSYFIITEHHGGSIEVDSQPGQGTCFIIKLPLALGKAAKQPT